MAKVENYFEVGMNFKNSRKKVLCTLLFCICSFFAGSVNGFLGTGGGIIFVLLLGALTKNNPKDNFATSLCATVILSLIGAFSYLGNSSIDFALIFRCGVFALAGGVLGAILLDKIKTRWLNLIFSLLIIYSGFCLIFR